MNKIIKMLDGLSESILKELCNLKKLKTQNSKNIKKLIIDNLDDLYSQQIEIFLEEQKSINIDKINDKAWQILRETDWTQIADEPLSQEERKEWRDYRVYLGNIEELWKNKQINRLEVMDFEEWKKNKPVFKIQKRRWYI